MAENTTEWPGQTGVGVTVTGAELLGSGPVAESLSGAAMAGVVATGLRSRTRNVWLRTRGFLLTARYQVFDCCFGARSLTENRPRLLLRVPATFRHLLPFHC